MNKLANVSPKRYAIYGRVSTLEQSRKEYSSVEVQVANATKYILSQGGIVAGTFADDGWTGTTLNRPDLKRMMNAAREGKFDAVVVTYMNRLGRGKIFTLAEASLNKFGVEIYTTDETFADGSAGYLQQMFKQMMDGYYPVQVSDWTKTKMENMVERGYCVGKLPYGLVAVPENDNPESPKRIVHDGEAATHVALAFDRMLQDRNLAAVCDFLKAVTHRAWTITTTKHLLTNRSYLGELRFGEWLNLHAFEPVVSVQVFEEVQTLLKKNRSRAPKSDNYAYLLRGLIHCPHCGCTYTNSFAKGGAVHYYECLLAKKRLTKCPVVRINCDSLHQAVLASINQAAQHLTVMSEVIRDSGGWGSASEQVLAERSNLGKRLQVLATQRTHLINALEKGFDVDDRYLANQKEKEVTLKRIANLDSEIEAATKLKPKAADVQAVWLQALELWELTTPEERVELMQSLVERVEIKEKDLAVVKMVSISEMPGQLFGTTIKLGAGVGFEPTTSGL